MKLTTLLGITGMVMTTSLAAAGCAAPTNDGADDEADTESTTEDLASSSCAPSLANGAVTAKQKALLDTIAFTEGTRHRGQDGYNVTFAYHYFRSCAHHPNLDICSGGYCSTAAGRYQFLTSTWRGLGYSNFGPANQDR